MGMAGEHTANKADDQSADVGTHVDAGDGESQDEVEEEDAAEFAQETAEPIPEMLTMGQSIAGNGAEDSENSTAGSNRHSVRMDRRRNRSSDNPRSQIKRKVLTPPHERFEDRADDIK